MLRIWNDLIAFIWDGARSSRVLIAPVWRPIWLHVALGVVQVRPVFFFSGDSSLAVFHSRHRSNDTLVHSTDSLRPLRLQVRSFALAHARWLWRPRGSPYALHELRALARGFFVRVFSCEPTSTHATAWHGTHGVIMISRE